MSKIKAGSRYFAIAMLLCLLGLIAWTAVPNCSDNPPFYLAGTHADCSALRPVSSPGNAHAENGGELLSAQPLAVVEVEP